MLYVPKIIPKHVEPGLRACRVLRKEWRRDERAGSIWVPVRVFYECGYGCIGNCLAAERERRCRRYLAATSLGRNVDWQGAAGAQEISEADAEVLLGAMLDYGFTTETKFTQPIALERYLRLVRSGEIVRYVDES